MVEARIQGWLRTVPFDIPLIQVALVVAAAAHCRLKTEGIM